SRGAPYRGSHREDAVFDRIAADLPRKRAIASRVRAGPIVNFAAAVRCGGHPGERHDKLDVLLVHTEVDALRPGIAKNRHRNFHRILPLSGSYLVDGLADPR